MNIVLPYFQFMSAGCCLGMMEAATTKAAAHVGGTKLEHIDQSLADLPTVRAYVARMRIKTDMVRALMRSEEHTSELQSPCNLVCRLLLEKKISHEHLQSY